MFKIYTLFQTKRAKRKRSPSWAPALKAYYLAPPLFNLYRGIPNSGHSHLEQRISVGQLIFIPGIVYLSLARMQENLRALQTIIVGPNKNTNEKISAHNTIPISFVSLDSIRMCFDWVYAGLGTQNHEYVTIVCISIFI